MLGKYTTNERNFWAAIASLKRSTTDPMVANLARPSLHDTFRLLSLVTTRLAACTIHGAISWGRGDTRGMRRSLRPGTNVTVTAFLADTRF